MAADAPSSTTGGFSPPGIRAFLRLRILLPLAALAVLLGFLVEKLVVTDAERVDRILEDLRSCALEGRWDEAFAHLDDDFALEEMRREDLEALVKKHLAGQKMERFDYWKKDVEILEDGLARARVQVLLRLPASSPMGARFLGTFRIFFRKRPDGTWVLTRAENLSS